MKISEKKYFCDLGTSAILARLSRFVKNFFIYVRKIEKNVQTYTRKGKVGTSIPKRPKIVGKIVGKKQRNTYQNPQIHQEVEIKVSGKTKMRPGKSKPET
ncbi:MAG: hypothetical protein IIZ39_13890 [Blautia sp.]|nr:hypothetical protein [Blautia sp.]